jgi:hypothetical protein
VLYFSKESEKLAMETPILSLRQKAMPVQKKGSEKCPVFKVMTTTLKCIFDGAIHKRLSMFDRCNVSAEGYLTEATLSH